MGKGIYGHLKPKPSGHGSFMLQPAATVDPQDAGALLSSLDDANVRFSTYLQRWNAKRIVARMEKLPGFEAFRTKLIQSLLFFYPKHGRELFEGHDPEGARNPASDLAFRLQDAAHEFHTKLNGRARFGGQADYLGVNEAYAFGQFLYVYSRLNPDYAREATGWPLEFPGYYGTLNPQVYTDGLFGLEEGLALELVRPLLGGSPGKSAPLSIAADETGYLCLRYDM